MSQEHLRTARPITRRQFAALFGIAGLGAGSVTRVLAQTPEVALPATFQESPSLASSVSDGSLPPVTERLPTNPLIVPMNERIGQYGGTWRTATVSAETVAPLGKSFFATTTATVLPFARASIAAIC